ncbi:MAG: DUF4349 domain-containing protein [Lachnospiraceae bacterium]|nr:DUF4349 domain-containing protein [Lachnospiraceae bacterium]
MISFLLISTLLTGCGASAKSESYMIAETMAAGAMDMSSNPEFYPDDVVMEEAALEKVESESGDTGSGLNSTSTVNTTPAINRKLIRTVNLNVETDAFDTLLETLNAEIAELNGYVEQSDISGNSMQSSRSRRWAHMTVRIPSTSLDMFITSVETNGNVTNKSETTTDVTLKYSDLESRKKSLTIEQDRIWELLEKADTLDAVIALEERLSEIRYELESMESQLRLYDNQVDYSTVHINIEEVKVYTPTAPESVGERIQKGFAKNLEGMKEFCVDLFVDLISSIPILVPVLAVILIVVFFIRKKLAGRKMKKMVKNLDAGLKGTDNGNEK